MKRDKRPIFILYQQPHTVFTFQEIALLWGETDQRKVIRKINYYVHLRLLHRIRNGIYAKLGDYDRRELATKILTPSYVSFETVLVDAGIVFQRYDRIFVATYVSRSLTVEGKVFDFRRLPEEVLTMPYGVTHQNGTSTASPERAFLDIVYTHKGYHFDNLRPLRWDIIDELAPYYGKKRMLTSLKKYRKLYDIQRADTQENTRNNP